MRETWPQPPVVLQGSQGAASQGRGRGVHHRRRCLGARRQHADGTACPPVEDVTLYGARGDGTTDDTRPVLAAVAAAKASGRPLYFPKGASGVYRITRAIPTEGFTRVFGEGATIIRAPGPVLTVAEREVTVEGLVLACEGPSPAIDPGEAEILRIDGVAAPGRGGLLPAARKGAVWIDGALSVAEEERQKGESGK